MIAIIFSIEFPNFRDYDCIFLIIINYYSLTHTLLIIDELLFYFSKLDYSFVAIVRFAHDIATRPDLSQYSARTL